MKLPSLFREAQAKTSSSKTPSPKTTTEPIKSYDEFLKEMGNELNISLDPNSQKWIDLYEQYKKFELSKDLLTNTDKKKMLAMGLDYSDPDDIDEYLKTLIKKTSTANSTSSDTTSDNEDLMNL